MQANLAERFWSKVDVRANTECWEWTGSRLQSTYGSLGWVDVGGRKQTQVGAHRVSFFLHEGYWPDVVRHTCDNPPCVNPAHLLGGSFKDNSRDMAQRGRSAAQKRTHCPSGHPYDDENTHITKQGHRKCRACNNANAKRQNLRQREQDLEGVRRRARNYSRAYRARNRAG